VRKKSKNIEIQNLCKYTKWTGPVVDVVRDKFKKKLGKNLFYNWVMLSLVTNKILWNSIKSKCSSSETENSFEICHCYAFSIRKKENKQPIILFQNPWKFAQSPIGSQLHKKLNNQSCVDLDCKLSTFLCKKHIYLN
jgi:hypothetical protein